MLSPDVWPVVDVATVSSAWCSILLLPHSVVVLVVEGASVEHFVEFLECLRADKERCSTGRQAWRKNTKLPLVRSSRGRKKKEAHAREEVQARTLKFCFVIHFLVAPCRQIRYLDKVGMLRRRVLVVCVTGGA